MDLCPSSRQFQYLCVTRTNYSPKNPQFDFHLVKETHQRIHGVLNLLFILLFLLRTIYSLTIDWKYNFPGLPLYTIRNHFLFDFKWSDRSKICNRGIRRQFCRKMKCIVTSTYLCIKWDRIGMLNDTHAVITQCSCYSFMCMISQKKSTG